MKKQVWPNDDTTVNYINVIVLSPEVVGAPYISLEGAYHFKEVYDFPWKVSMQTLRSFQEKEFKSSTRLTNFDTSYFAEMLPLFCLILKQKQKSNKL